MTKIRRLKREAPLKGWDKPFFCDLPYPNASFFWLLSPLIFRAPIVSSFPGHAKLDKIPRKAWKCNADPTRSFTQDQGELFSPAWFDQAPYSSPDGSAPTTEGEDDLEPKFRSCTCQDTDVGGRDEKGMFDQPVHLLNDQVSFAVPIRHEVDSTDAHATLKSRWHTVL